MESFFDLNQEHRNYTDTMISRTLRFEGWTSYERLYYSVFSKEETEKVRYVFYINFIAMVEIRRNCCKKTVITTIMLMIAFATFIFIFVLKTKAYCKFAIYPSQFLISWMNMTYLHKYYTTIHILVI